jgi:hypothetical protein
MMTARHGRLQFAVVFALLLGATGAAAAQPDDRTTRWIEDVLLGPEYGGDGEICARWIKSPTLSVFGANQEQSAHVRTVVDQINGTLESTPLRRITLLPPADTAADIHVYFARLSDFPRLAGQLGFQYHPGNWGYFWVRWNGAHEIFNADVLLASDRLRGATLRHFALEEITQSLGLMGDSPVYPDSVFYSRGSDGGDAQRLSALDRKLIAFLYTYIAPGAGRAELRRALAQFWTE